MRFWLWRWRLSLSRQLNLDNTFSFRSFTLWFLPFFVEFRSNEHSGLVLFGTAWHSGLAREHSGLVRVPRFGDSPAG